MKTPEDFKKEHMTEFIQERIAIAVESGVHIKSAQSQAISDWNTTLKRFLEQSKNYLLS